MPTRITPYFWGPCPPISLIAVLLCFGVSLVGFGNADRIVSTLTRAGGTMPGIVIETRQIRTAGVAQSTYISRVAFRDAAGAIQIREAAAVPFRPAPDQPVQVLWKDGQAQVRVDLPVARRPSTELVLLLLNAAGLLLWGMACWLMARRLSFRITRSGQPVENE